MNGADSQPAAASVRTGGRQIKACPGGSSPASYEAHPRGGVSLNPGPAKKAAVQGAREVLESWGPVFGTFYNLQFCHLIIKVTL